MARVLKINKEKIKYLWLVTCHDGLSDEYFLSYDDAIFYCTSQIKLYDNSWFDYHDIVKVSYTSPMLIPDSGWVWVINGKIFDSRHEALKISDNPALIKIEII